MRAGCLMLACAALLGATGTLWAGPFTEVPAGHWAYEASRNLAAMNLLSVNPATDFSGDPQLTRFEFGIAVVEPLTQVAEAVRSLPSGADQGAVLSAVARALDLSPRYSEKELAAAAADLRRLGQEFADVLRSLGLDPDRAGSALDPLTDSESMRQWRAEALQGIAAPPESAALQPAQDTLRLPFAQGTVALTFNRDLRSPELLDRLAASAAVGRIRDVEGPVSAEPALRDPVVSRLRTAYEYGLGSTLTLSLAYEEIARRGHGLSALDAASLASVGVGYRVTPSASLTLSYSLLEYSNYVFDTPSVRDRVAETAVSIEF